MLLAAKPYSAHPIAEIFPLHAGRPLDDLVASVKEHGLLEDIVGEAA